MQLRDNRTSSRLPETEYLINMMEPPLLSEECLNSRLTQMNMSALSSLLKEVLQDGIRSETSTTSYSVINIHLQSLQRFHSELPIYFCLRPTLESEKPGSSHLVDGANARQKASILNVHVLHLGIKCQLLQPALIQLLQHTKTETLALIDFASQCVESAREIVEICREVVGSGFEVKGHWVVLHFLFKALLITTLAAVQAQRDHKIDNWNEAVETISTAVKLLEGSSHISLLATPEMDQIDTFLESLKFGARK